VRVRVITLTRQCGPPRQVRGDEAPDLAET